MYALKKKIAMLLAVILCMQIGIVEVQAANMTISDKGISLIKSFEGCKLTAYKAVSTEKYYTIGWGHYGSDVYPGMIITQAEADALLVSDLQKYIGYVNAFLNKNSITIEQSQFDALVSFTYNLGNVWVSEPTFKLKTYLINGISNYSEQDIRTAFTNWNKSGGVVLDGLTRRRNAEADLFLTGKSNDIPEVQQAAGYWLPCQTYALSTGRISVYETIGGSPTSGRYIDGSTDRCTINEIYINGWCRVTYPISSGTRTAYTPLSEFISNASPVEWVATGDFTAYQRSSGTETIGSVATGDVCVRVGEENGRIQVMYPVTGQGYYKMGWIDASAGYNPQGCLDMVTGNIYSVDISGWAFDNDNINENLRVDVYVGGSFSGSLTANQERTDVHNIYQCGTHHGYSGNIKVDKSKAGTQTVEVYAVNIGAGTDELLGTRTVEIGSDTENSKISIITQPESQYVENGDYATFSIAASGNNLQYQWQYSTDGITWKNSGLDGNTTTSLLVQGLERRNGQKYRCVVTDDTGNQMVSNIVVLTIKAEVLTYGDVDGNGAVNLKDVVALRRYLSDEESDTSIKVENSDVNVDDLVNMKDVVILRRYLSGGWNIELPYISENENQNKIQLDADLSNYTCTSYTENNYGTRALSFSYGKSELGRELICWCIEPQEFDRTVLLNFEIHGWEDEYASDGELLVKLGNDLVKNYSSSKDMKGCRLLIIPSSNPDALEEGTTNNGFGRCNALGIDLNRDFDANHIVYNSPRNYTQYPFSAAESRALRDLVWNCNPDVVIDFHGWLNYTLGSKDLAELFSIYTDLSHKRELTSDAHGYFSYWAQLQGAEAMLVEFKNSNSIETSEVISVVDKIIADNYGDKQTEYATNPIFDKFDEITSYALTSNRIYTQKAVGENTKDYGYIDGANDVCTIKQVYSNGWCRVSYPVSSGYQKTGYCKLSEFVEEEIMVESYVTNVVQNAKVYTTLDKSKEFGSVWTTDSITVIAEKGSMVQIIYPVDSGGFKMGWIEKAFLHERH